jgi:predicted phage terminase large subunit-like protein
MADFTRKDYEKQYAEIMQRIQRQATPFPNDTIAKKQARIERAKKDKFFFAVTYFPHYIEVKDEYKTCWKDPGAEYDWVNAGFSPDHKKFFEIADDLDKLNIVAGFRESAKDTLLSIVDVIHKIVFKERWFIAIIAKTEIKAETKCVPIKLELEVNARLINDFGNLRGQVSWEYGDFVTNTGIKVKGYGREQALRGEMNFGHRPDHIILNDIDDPTKPDSAGQVIKFVNSIKEDIRFAVNSPKWSALFLCNYTIKGNIVDEMIIGKNTAHFGKHIFRALVPNEQATKEEREIAKKCRSAGFADSMKSAWEHRHPTLRLLQEKKDDADSFNTERMMYPRSRKDQKFKDNFFRYHTREELRLRRYVFYTSVDPSSTEGNDYKAVITMGIAIKEDGTLHMPIVKADIQPEGIDWMLEASWRHEELFKPIKVVVEENSYKDFVRREYKRLMAKKGRPLPFFPINHSRPKAERIERLVPLVKEGIITFDKDDPDQELLIRQFKAFPNGGNVKDGGVGDDGPDAAATDVEVAEVYANDGAIEYKSLSKRTAQFKKGTW